MLPLIVDAHEDIAYNILNFGRDYTRAAVETRRLEYESGSAAPEHNGETLLGWPDYQRGRVAVVFSTLFVSPIRRRTGEWDKQSYADFDQAHRLYRTQLDAYHKLADDHPDHFRLIASRIDLETVLTHWADSKAESHPVGLVPLMEGAEGVRTPSELDEWWEWGVRVIGPAWAGTRFCGGTREPGPLTDEGHLLLKAMADIGFTLDLSHMDELSARQSLDLYPGPIIASHANAAALVPGYDGNRLLRDDVIQGILERDGIIGVVPFCRFLTFEWKFGDPRDSITLEMLAAHVDRICQMAGDARHVGLGSDFDGGFGLSAVPAGVDTIADLQKLGPILAAKGYNDEQVAAVLGKNWLRHLQTFLP
ncbi:MAG: membrane dipeptidase [Chloroflexi bacterium]|nr:membrane dipeptidase [Chloroflexota bacterium]